MAPLLARRASPLALSRFLSRAAMSSAAAAPRKYEFLVVVPDKPDVRAKRMEVRPQHFANMKPFLESGDWKMGGALLNSVPKDDEADSLDFMGSTLVCISTSKEEVLEQLKKDIYATSGVWDMDKVQIYPFKCAFRNP
ncbi:hypothetical protein B0I35DRAFT_421173 [Stachybotrys elegans]|uniref:YCII-related domain-containing protein n=1 Tax=Stachybotrys elegans TaxID=80388 RepID=A0A8K0T0P1_9HYPO|nr:hypothetical protein B0I35DRAFT_421173 [Stachybotrys elegans]